METLTGNTSQAIQDEALLIRHILDGHTELFRQLAGRYAEQVLRMVALTRFDARQASFQTWLMRIAYHTTLKHYRQHQMHKGTGTLCICVFAESGV